MPQSSTEPIALPATVLSQRLKIIIINKMNEIEDSKNNDRKSGVSVGGQSGVAKGRKG